MSFEEAYNEFKIYASKRHKKQGFDTITNNFKLHILPYFKDKLVCDLTKQDILSWQNIILEKNYSNNFNNALHSVFSSFLEYCILIDLIELNVVRLVGNFPKKFEEHNYDVYNIREFKLFRKSLKNRIYREYFNFMYFYGTRPSECIALRFSDLDGHFVHIRHNIHRRGKRLLDTPKNQSSIRDIKISLFECFRLYILKCYYIKIYGKWCDDYFIFGGKKPLSTTSIDRYKHNACIKANLREITSHQFRHSYATRKIHKKVPIDVVSRSMGHSRVSTTLDIYVHKEKRVTSTLFPVRFNFFNTITNNFKKISQSIITFFM